MRNKFWDQPILVLMFSVFEVADSRNKYSYFFRNFVGISKNKLHLVCGDDDTYQQTKPHWKLNFERDQEFSILLDISGHSLLSPRP